MALTSDSRRSTPASSQRRPLRLHVPACVNEHPGGGGRHCCPGSRPVHGSVPCRPLLHALLQIGEGTDPPVHANSSMASQMPSSLSHTPLRPTRRPEFQNCTLASAVRMSHINFQAAGVIRCTGNAVRRQVLRWWERHAAEWADAARHRHREAVRGEVPEPPPATNDLWDDAALQDVWPLLR